MDVPAEDRKKHNNRQRSIDQSNVKDAQIFFCDEFIRDPHQRPEEADEQREQNTGYHVASDLSQTQSQVLPKSTTSTHSPSLRAERSAAAPIAIYMAASQALMAGLRFSATEDTNS